MVQEICPELFLIEVPLPNSPLKYLNAYVVRSPERSLVIDTGLNRSKNGFLVGIAAGNNDLCLAVLRMLAKQLQ